MKVKRHNPEQIIRKLRTAEQLLNQGQAAADACRALEVLAPTYYRWQQLYGGMQTKSAVSYQRQRPSASSRQASPKEQELELENTRLKRLLADAELDKAMLQPQARHSRRSQLRREVHLVVRRAVVVLQDRFRVSQRRTCRLTGQHRNTQRRPVPLADIEEQKLRRWIRELARRHVRWGRRLVYRRLRLDGWSVNHKRVQRIWREEGLQRPLPRRRKRSRPSGGGRELLRSEYLHHFKAIDFQFDQTMDGRTLKFLNVIDEFSRVCLANRVGRRCKAVDVIDTIEELLKLYPPATHLRMDNGPEFIAYALQEWCTGSGTGTAYIPPGSPWEDPFVESFNGRFRHDFLNIELFATLQEAKLLAEQHRIEYNVYGPHSALQGRTPLEVLQQWKAA